ncbi:hypothetical protein [Photorhabdus temperata]|uniref:Uncharacterized protein n=1 Tax=Photorhabdus temperata J3 TaxID=1389415 RepID=U7R2E4_PHOTE|nr:hypothetical protein [Photorhabdus temperata]ERT13800.1 hypothetical protein O185_06790 [Photorhabdus temperata J3]
MTLNNRSSPKAKDASEALLVEVYTNTGTANITNASEKTEKKRASMILCIISITSTLLSIPLGYFIYQIESGQYSN